ncbi:hypothetical protein ZZ1p0033 [Acinetobacter phage ZZ1]|jgi:hypothetical protein|uniref:Uncharacterized protein n=2 Tax=Caudoviricetes TaxID=2731619 RepID=I3WVS6_9CAUD|nr:hypothetical protein ZZ1p0033 [Acinetobacter phage ZZ1]AFL47596.1 hypothetical protein ZZ1p0033 [Acinetobacter phage ZZ1]
MSSLEDEWRAAITRLSTITVECWECHTPLIYKGSIVHPIGSQIWVPVNSNNQAVLGKYFSRVK